MSKPAMDVTRIDTPNVLPCSPLGAKILCTVTQRGPMSRADLARALGHSRSKTSEGVEDLLAQNLVREIGIAKSSGGRPPVLVEFNSTAGRLVAIDLDAYGLHIAVTDLANRILRVEHESISSGEAPQSVIQRLTRHVRSMFENGPGGTEPLTLGIALSFPGHLALHNGRILHSFSLPHWKGISLKAVLEKEFHCPVYVATQADAYALAECRFGKGQTQSEFFYVLAGPPTTSSLVTAYSLDMRKCGAAGQLGHVVINQDGASCTCGKRGCLDAELAQTMQRMSSHVYGTPVSSPSILAAIVDAAESGDAVAVTLLQNYCHALAQALSSVISMVDPAIIVLGGHTQTVAGKLAEQISSYLQEHRRPSGCDAVGVQPSRVGLNAGILGASVLVSHELLTSNSHTKHLDGLLTLVRP